MWLYSFESTACTNICNYHSNLLWLNRSFSHVMLPCLLQATTDHASVRIIQWPTAGTAWEQSIVMTLILLMMILLSKVLLFFTNSTLLIHFIVFQQTTPWSLLMWMIWLLKPENSVYTANFCDHFRSTVYLTQAHQSVISSWAVTIWRLLQMMCRFQGERLTLDLVPPWSRLHQSFFFSSLLL